MEFEYACQECGAEVSADDVERREVVGDIEVTFDCPACGHWNVILGD